MKTLELLVRVGTTVYVKTEDFLAKGLNYSIEEALDLGHYVANGESHTFAELAESTTGEEFNRLFGQKDVKFTLVEHQSYTNEELADYGFSKIYALLDATVYLDKNIITPDNCVDLIKKAFTEYEVPITGGFVPSDGNEDSSLLKVNPKYSGALLYATSACTLDGFDLAAQSSNLQFDNEPVIMNTAY